MIHRRPRSPPPSYILIPALIIPGTLAYGYYHFTDYAPFTKRKRLLATSPEFERRLGDKEYESLLHKYRGKILPPNHRATITVNRVGRRVSVVADKFSRKYLPEEVWKNASPYTYTVVRSDTANAFVLPNNHVFVLTGLFKFARDEDELAAVLGHEMAHNLARHAGEKISGGIVMGIMANFMFLLDPTGLLFTLFMPASRLLYDLPHSREAEVEADHIGLHLAAEACYDPKASKRVFGAMDHGDPSGKGFKAPPEFLSTHPSYGSRLSNFDKWLPEAQSKFNDEGGMKCQHVREEMRRARIHAAETADRREER